MLLASMLSIFLTFFTFTALASTDQQIAIPTTTGKLPLTAIVSSSSVSSIYKKPAVLILIGSGEGSTDDSTRPFNPFQTLARKTADAGFVTLRFDKRGTGYNKNAGEFRRQTLSDYYQDARDAVSYLKSRPDINEDQIYIVGHSIGTYVASKLAGEVKLKGLVLIAGPDSTMLPVMEEQQRFYLNVTHKNDPAAIERILNFQLKPFREIQQGTFDIRNCDPFLCQTEGNLQILNGQILEFWQEILKVDQRVHLQNVPNTTPLLCIVGKNDWVVEAEHSRATCRHATQLGLSTAFIEIPDSDHFFSIANTKEESLQLLMNRNFSRIQENNSFLESIISWLKELEFSGKSGVK